MCTCVSMDICVCVCVGGGGGGGGGRREEEGGGGGGVKVEATRPDVLHVCMLVHIHMHVSVRYLPVATPHHLGCLSVAPSIDWEGRKSYTISLLVVQGQNVRHLPLGSYPAFPHP